MVITDGRISERYQPSENKLTTDYLDKAWEIAKAIYKPLRDKEGRCFGEPMDQRVRVPPKKAIRDPFSGAVASSSL